MEIQGFLTVTAMLLYNKRRMDHNCNDNVLTHQGLHGIGLSLPPGIFERPLTKHALEFSSNKPDQWPFNEAI